jgi:altronate dehydratase
MSAGDENRPGDRGWDAIAIHADDDVAVALRDLAAGEAVRVRRAGAIERVVAAAAIPLGHKLALRALAAGAVVRKYGESIGAASAPIAPGEHVHVHNLRSQRAQGLAGKRA